MLCIVVWLPMISMPIYSKGIVYHVIVLVYIIITLFSVVHLSSKVNIVRRLNVLRSVIMEDYAKSTTTM